MMEKLRALDLHYADVEARLSAPETYEDPALVARLNKEQRELEPVVMAYRAYQRRRQDLEDAEAVRLLEEAGYPCHSAGQCVACLIRRLRESEEFPHEIGLFLSYPPEDVRGFIENKACRFKCAGLWKVYGDEERAKELFRQYKRCTDRCCALWRAGSGLAQLAV